jgi:DeoR family transcriptional regulator, myo-inositol catabolism operon repressor
MARLLHQGRDLACLAPTALALALAGVAPCLAEFPDRPIRVIVPLPAGGIVDLVVRLATQRIGEEQGWSFVIENKAAARGHRRHRCCRKGRAGRLLRRKLASLQELCDHFGVSLSTLRRDLTSVEQRGLIRKTCGGVAAQPTRQLVTPYEERDIINRAAKQKIARAAAAGRVDDGDIIFIDFGSTVMGMIDFLEQARGVTILTNNINIIVKAIHMENIQIITLPGVLNRQTYSFAGESAANILTNYNINKSLMGTTGISISNGVTNSSSTEVEIKKDGNRSLPAKHPSPGWQQERGHFSFYVLFI